MDTIRLDLQKFLFIHILMSSVYCLEFQKWKRNVEEEQGSSYVKTTGIKQGVQYFNCNRSGVFTSKGKGKRLLKSQGKMLLLTLYVYNVKHCMV